MRAIAPARDGRAGARTRTAIGMSIMALALVALTALLVTSGIYSVFGLLAVGGVLTGASITGGAVDERRGDGIPRDSPLALLPDDHTARLTDQVLSSLDGIEHRRIELGTPWPQLCVGPTGVSVIEVCDLDGPVELTAGGIVSLQGGPGTPDGLPVAGRQGCARCSKALEARAAAVAALATTDLEVPLRTIAVVASGTAVCTGDDAPPGIWLVSVDELADVLARGPVLPMPVVDAAFLVLSGVAAVERSA